jgi:hypothetical protein
MKKLLFLKDSFAKKAWGSIVLIVLALVMIGSGTYLNSQSNWAKRVDINWYNQGVSAYNLPAELLPATDNRPEEYPIVRAAAYFQQAALESTDSRLRALAFYNLGTLMAGDALAFISGTTQLVIASEGISKLAEGISKLAEVIRIDPNNENAKYNLELLEKIQDSLVSEKVTGPLGLPTEHNVYSRIMVHKGY